jgi:hypothetical protein
VVDVAGNNVAFYRPPKSSMAGFRLDVALNCVPMARKPLTSAMARNAVLINQCATPGLGSIMAGRYLSGAGQLLLALTGFSLFIVWFVAVLRQFYGQIQGNVEVKSVGWIGWTGLAVFAAAWFWALGTSLSLMREVKRLNAAAVFTQTQPPPLPD